MKTSPHVCTVHRTPLGPVLLRASSLGLSGLWFEGQRHHPDPEEVASWKSDREHPLLLATGNQLDEYFARLRQRFDLPLDLSGGTPFQRAVWQALLAIPFGRQGVYGELARQLGRPHAVRAVGSAVGRNPVSIIVPCHRVIGANGSLTGYAGGLDRKRALLALEGH